MKRRSRQNAEGAGRRLRPAAGLCDGGGDRHHAVHGASAPGLRRAAAEGTVADGARPAIPDRHSPLHAEGPEAGREPGGRAALAGQDRGSGEHQRPPLPAQALHRSHDRQGRVAHHPHQQRRFSRIPSTTSRSRPTRRTRACRPGGIAEFAGMGQIPAGPVRGGRGAMRRRPSDSAGTGGGSRRRSQPASQRGGLRGRGVSAGWPGGSRPEPRCAARSQIRRRYPPQPGAGPSSGSGNWGQSSSFGSNTPPTGQPAFPGQIGNPVNSNNPGGSPYPAGPNCQRQPAVLPATGHDPGRTVQPPAVDRQSY